MHRTPPASRMFRTGRRVRSQAATKRIVGDCRSEFRARREPGWCALKARPSIPPFFRPWRSRHEGNRSIAYAAAIRQLFVRRCRSYKPFITLLGGCHAAPGDGDQSVDLSSGQPQDTVPISSCAATSPPAQDILIDGLADELRPVLRPEDTTSDLHS